ncbi:MAG TPA: DUF1080 domain-containing protein [Flavisolibacter sp.]|nr:DUF1080 domain-containing protein [Flavisolibacter sp.]
MKKNFFISRLQILQYLLLSFSIMFFAISPARSNSVLNRNDDPSPLEGRWDLTINVSGKELPAWLEVSHSGFHTLVGEFVGSSGSARPISKVSFSDGKLSFSIPPQWEKGSNDLSIVGVLQEDKISGTMTYPNGENYNWTGIRAPSLQRKIKPVWDKSIRLFNGTDLKGWHAMGDNQWKAERGILRSPRSGSNLITDASFRDFKLHIEFRYPKGSNSGVYLRGRYEVQIADSYGLPSLKDQFGAIYGFISPSQMAAKKAGEWQSYDITLIGKMVTVVANGKTIICNQEIPGITGGAIDSKEDEPGPLLIQGDHGPVEFRNIILIPAH